MGKPAPVLKRDGSLALGKRAEREWDGPRSCVDFHKVMKETKLWWNNHFRFEFGAFCKKKGFDHPDNPCMEKLGGLWDTLDIDAKQRITRSYIQDKYSGDGLRLWRDETIITEEQMRADAGLPQEPTEREKRIVAGVVADMKQRMH